MYYVINLLAAMLIGTAIGAALGPRNNFVLFSALVTIALGAATIVFASWVPLAIGTAVLLVAQSMRRSAHPARA